MRDKAFEEFELACNFYEKENFIEAIKHYERSISHQHMH